MTTGGTCLEQKNKNPRLAYPNSQKELAVALLCRHYQDNPDFMADLSALANQNGAGWQLLSCYLSLNYADLERLSSWWVNEAHHIRPNFMGSADRLGIPDIVKDAEAIASKWGLTATWGAPLLLKWASELTYGDKSQEDKTSSPVTFSGLAFLKHWTWEAKLAREFHLRPVWDRLFPSPDIKRYLGEELPAGADSLGIEELPAVPEAGYADMLDSLPDSARLPVSTVVLVEHYDPTLESRQSFLDRAKAALVRQAEEIEDICREHGMEKQGGKSELERHVEWLYERIALKLTPRQIVEKHNHDSKPPGQDSVEEGIHNVAQLLEITSPRNRSPYTR
jgi:hypothetical protein